MPFIVPEKHHAPLPEMCEQPFAIDKREKKLGEVVCQVLTRWLLGRQRRMLPRLLDKTIVVFWVTFSDVLPLASLLKVPSLLGLLGCLILPCCHVKMGERVPRKY